MKIKSVFMHVKTITTTTEEKLIKHSTRRSSAMLI